MLRGYKHDTNPLGGLYYDLVPGVVYTVADEADIDEIDENEEDDQAPLKPPPIQERLQRIQNMQIAR